MSDLLKTHSLNQKKGQQRAKSERGTLSEEKPLSRHYSEQGGSKQDLLKCFQTHGNYIAVMIMSKYVEMMYSSDFHDLTPEQQKMECVKIFSMVMSEYVEEFN